MAFTIAPKALLSLPPPVDAVAASIQQNALAATVLAGIVWGVTRICRNPAVQHLLWLVVLLKLISPPLISLPFGFTVSRGPGGANLTLWHVASPHDFLEDNARLPRMHAVSEIPAQIDAHPSGVARGASLARLRPTQTNLQTASANPRSSEMWPSRREERNW